MKLDLRPSPAVHAPAAPAAYAAELDVVRARPYVPSAPVPNPPGQMARESLAGLDDAANPSPPSRPKTRAAPKGRYRRNTKRARSLKLPVEMDDMLRQVSRLTGESVNGFIVGAIRDALAPLMTTMRLA